MPAWSKVSALVGLTIGPNASGEPTKPEVTFVAPGAVVMVVFPLGIASPGGARVSPNRDGVRRVGIEARPVHRVAQMHHAYVRFELATHTLPSKFVGFVGNRAPMPAVTWLARRERGREPIDEEVEALTQDCQRLPGALLVIEGLLVWQRNIRVIDRDGAAHSGVEQAHVVVHARAARPEGHAQATLLIEQA